MDGWVQAGVMNFFSTWDDTVSVSHFFPPSLPAAPAGWRRRTCFWLLLFCEGVRLGGSSLWKTQAKFLWRHQIALLFTPHHAVIFWTSLTRLSCLERKLAMDVILPAVSLNQSKPAQQSLPSGILGFYCVCWSQTLIRFNSCLKIIHLLRCYSSCNHGFDFVNMFSWQFLKTLSSLIKYTATAKKTNK